MIEVSNEYKIFAPKSKEIEREHIRDRQGGINSFTILSKLNLNSTPQNNANAYWGLDKVLSIQK